MTRSTKSTRRSRGKKLSNARTDALLKELVVLNKQEVVRASPIKRDQAPMMEGPKDKIYTFWQTITGVQIVCNASTETDGDFNITLSLFGNATALSSTFDTYRIQQVTVKFFPAATPPATGSYGPFYTAMDYDDATITNLATILEYDTLYVCQPGTYFERTFQPRVAIAAYSGVFTSFAQQKSPWIDCGSPTVIHYGLKYALPNGTTSTPLWNTTVTAVLQFKNTR